MPAMLHLCARNDVNGNPRRAFVLIDDDGSELAAWDEGYYGTDAVPGHFHKKASYALRKNVTVKEYKRVLKDVPSPAWAHDVKGYESLR